VILHSFSSVGWEGLGLSGRPLIRDAMPVLIDDDLCFEDADGPRPTVAMNRWLRELERWVTALRYVEMLRRLSDKETRHRRPEASHPESSRASRLEIRGLRDASH
jgi:hypothetical protein